MRHLLPDIRLAFRALRRTPGFSASAIVALAVALAATTAILSVFDRLVWHPASVPDPDSLVSIWFNNPQRNVQNGGSSIPRYEEVIQKAQSFASAGMSGFDTATLAGGGDAIQLTALRVSASFLPTLGVAPARGRLFVDADDVPNGPAVCILSHEFWQSQFGGDEDLLGSTIRLDGRPWRVVGILPPRLTPPFAQVQVLLPRVADVGFLTPQQIQSGATFFQPIARLKRGVSLEQAAGELKVLSAAYKQRDSTRLDSSNISYPRLFADVLGSNVAPAVRALLGAVACVLLIACANTASLFLNRLLARRKDIAIRMAIGANRGRIVRQYLLEALLFTAVAAAIGVAIAYSSLGYLSAQISAQLPGSLGLAINWRVLAWACAIAFVAAMMTGLLPAIQASRPQVVEHLKDGARGTSTGHGARLRQGLVIAEVTLSTVLLTASALLLVTFIRLERTPLGFETRGIATAALGLPTTKYQTPAQMADFYDRVVEQLEADKTVVSAAVAIGAPLLGTLRMPYAVGGRPIPALGERPVTTANIVSPEYFKLFGLRLVAGRTFSPDDRANAPLVCVLNQTLAKRLFGSDAALGESILLGRDAKVALRVVGVIADIRSAGANSPVPDELYMPLRQRPGPAMVFIAKTTGDSATLQSAMQRAIASVDREQALSFFATMETTAAQAVGTQQLLASLTAVFAGLAVALALVGLYSVLAYTVAQRSSELGVRIALGASSHQIVSLVLRYGMRLVTIGIVLGLASAVIVARVIRQLLFGVDSIGLVVYAGVAALFALIAIAACVIPSKRAARIDPLVTLRSV